MKYIFSFLSVVLLLFSCKKNEGEGGNGSIMGTVITKRYTQDFSQYLGNYAAKDEDVFIQYGDFQGVSDRAITDYNGNFTFQNLYPGSYTIFLYSKDTTFNDLSGKVVIKQGVTLDKNEDKNIGILYRADNN